MLYLKDYNKIRQVREELINIRDSLDRLRYSLERYIDSDIASLTGGIEATKLIIDIKEQLEVLRDMLEKE